MSQQISSRARLQQLADGLPWFEVYPLTTRWTWTDELRDDLRNVLRQANRPAATPSLDGEGA